MNTGGEAADQMVRMMLSSGELAVRLSGSAIKNLAAISLALAQNHKTLSGKVSMARMLRETRDLRLFPMSAQQYQTFRQLAREKKILYAAVKDKDGGGQQVDLLLPATDVERANQVFARMLYAGPQPEHAEEKGAQPPKKERRSGRDSRDTGRGSAMRRTADRPSVEARLKSFRQSQQRQSAPARTRARTRQPVKSK